MANDGKQLTPESMRTWEERLGPEKVAKAIAILRSHGWESSDGPPMWVWAEAFRMAEGVIPEVWGGSHRPLVTKNVLGFELF